MLKTGYQEEILSVNPTNQVSINRTLQLKAVDTTGIPRVQI